MTIEKRRFGMDSNLLMHVIQRQAGTLAKAALEAVMNSVDAGATTCTITLDSQRMLVTDDGRGFVDRHEVEQYFERFGTPHQEGDAVYGHFRLGRGQLFCYGANDWRSGRFRMQVDIKTDGLDYRLHEETETLPGCAIDIALYEPLLPSQLDRTLREIRAFVAYAPIVVSLNGTVVSTNPTTEKWDVETEDAWVSLRPQLGRVDVYNMGMFVESIGSYRFGTGGVVVSKKALRLNMARNQVDSACPVWRRVTTHLRGDQLKRTRAKSARLSDEEKGLLAEAFIAGELDSRGMREQKFLTDVCGRDVSLNQVMQSPLPWSSAPKGDRVGEAAHRSKMALVFANDTLDRFGVTTMQALRGLLADCLEKHMGEMAEYMVQSLRKQRRILEADVLGTLVNEAYEQVPEQQLTEIEKAARRAVEVASKLLNEGMRKQAICRPGTYRRLLVGMSAVADAWTDGCSFICIERKHLKKLYQGLAGAGFLARLIVHEYLHSESDTGSHAHDYDFYHAFHELMLADDGFVDRAAEAMLRRFTADLDRLGKKKTKKQMASVDVSELVAHAAQRLSARQEINP